MSVKTELKSVYFGVVFIKYFVCEAAVSEQLPPVFKK